MRSLVLLVVAALLVACGTAPYADPGPPASSAAPTPRTTVTAASVHRDPEPVLLPRPCTAHDGLRFHRVPWSPSTGERASSWRLRSDVRCTLDGIPRVTLLDAAGRPMPFGFDHGFMDPITRHPGPVVVGPGRSLVVAIDKYRCDSTPDPPYSRTARLRLPGIDEVFTVRAEEALCDVAQDGPNTVHVPPLGAFRPPQPRYAVHLGSSFVRGGIDTWARADVDGDGRPDVVLLTGRGRLEVRLAAGVTLTHSMPTSGRLQAFPDLNGDGVPEILAAYTAIGCCGGYDLLDSRPVILTVEQGALRRIRIPLLWDIGHGDLYAGIVCHGDRVTEVSTETAASAPTHLVRRVAWRIEGTHATRLSTTIIREAGDPMALTATHCQGMDATGWAA